MEDNNMTTCNICGGHGYWFATGMTKSQVREIPCKNCSGTGKVKVYAYSWTTLPTSCIESCIEKAHLN